MSPHIFYLGAVEAERAVAAAVRGAGPGPAVIEPERRPGAAAKARLALGAAMIRAGEAVRGIGHLGPDGPTSIGADGRA